MEEQLRCRDLECVQLQNDLCDSKVTLQREKDQLKKSLKEQKDYNLQQQQNLEIVNAHLEEVVSTSTTTATTITIIIITSCRMLICSR